MAPKGTADAIFQNIYTLQVERPDLVLILSGDHIYKMDYRKMIDFHLDKGADLTVAAIRMDRSLSREFGVMEIDGNWKIIGFEEKPEEPKAIPGDSGGILASMGIYLFRTEYLLKVLTETAVIDFGQHVIPLHGISDWRLEWRRTAKYRDGWRNRGFHRPEQLAGGSIRRQCHDRDRSL